MLDINLFRISPDIIRKNLEKRKDERISWVDEIINLDAQWRSIKQEVDALRSKRNKITLEISQLKKEDKDPSKQLEEAAQIPHIIKEKEFEMGEMRAKLDNFLMRMPNILHESVPYGESEEENVVIKEWGEKTERDFNLKGQVEISESLNIADFEKATKIAGAGFFFLKGDLALLNQALIRFAIDEMVKKDYTFIEPPLMMRKKPYEGVTDLGDFKDVMYKIEDEDLYLIATAEHPLTAMFMDEVLNNKELPIKLVGLSYSFRKEIGSHGIDEKGLWRRHQFNKVEQIIICNEEDSWKLHEELLKNAENIFQKLKLPYRIITICTGDIGTVAAKKYDIEVWLPKQQKYGEVVSCSNCTDYQARRLNIKYIDGKEKKIVHTLNSTAIATSRALVAILENYQNEDGTITIPEVLRPYMLGKTKIS